MYRKNPKSAIGNCYGDVDFLWFVFSVVLDCCGRSTSRHAPRRLNPSQQGKRIVKCTLESSGASALHSKCPRCRGTATEGRTGDQAARLIQDLHIRVPIPAAVVAIRSPPAMALPFALAPVLLPENVAA